MGTLLLHVGHWRHQWTDDAFITFRYARNFLAGNGMVFNPGDAVEGITNLGWALLLTPLSERDPLADDRALPALVFVAFLFAAALQNGDIFPNFRLLARGAPAELVEALDAARLEAERAATGCE